MTHCTPPPASLSSLSGALAREAAELRREIVEALFAAKGGDYGGSLSVLDILLALSRTPLRANPQRPRQPGRARAGAGPGRQMVGLRLAGTEGRRARS